MRSRSCGTWPSLTDLDYLWNTVTNNFANEIEVPF